MTTPEEPNPQADARKQVADAHSLLVALRAKLEKHPELEDAILRLEYALDKLTVKTSGLL